MLLALLLTDRWRSRAHDSCAHYILQAEVYAYGNVLELRRARIKRTAVTTAIGRSLHGCRSADV